MNAQLTEIATMLEAPASAQELETLAKMLLTAQEKERQRIASDLHDGIGQSLSTVSFAIGRLRQQVGHRLTAAEDKKFECLIGRISSAIDEVRRVSMDLRPTLLDDLGVVSAIDWFCEEFRQITTGMEIIQTVRADENAIPEPVKLAIFRILQEACSNACKYSQAHRFSVLLETDAEGIRLEVADDGVGFDPASERCRFGAFGLFSMRERARLTDGFLDVLSKPGKGTRIFSAWPVEKAVRRASARSSMSGRRPYLRAAQRP